MTMTCLSAASSFPRPGCMPDSTKTARAPATRVGTFAPFDLLEQDQETARQFLAQAADAGIDYVCCGDHVSFFGGSGFDGLLQATALAMLHPTLPVHVGVYLLPLRHPVLVARQLADFARIAPGRLVFGVGVGGEDRHEISVCGVDPATRGERMNECLTVLRQLMAGTAVSFHGVFFDLDEAVGFPGVFSASTRPSSPPLRACRFRSSSAGDPTRRSGGQAG